MTMTPTRPTAADTTSDAALDQVESVGPVDPYADSDLPEPSLVTPGASTDAVKDYLRQIGRVPLLTAEQEVTVARRIVAAPVAPDTDPAGAPATAGST